MPVLLPRILARYVERALSLSNRKVFDGDSNAPYRVVVEFAEFGPGIGLEAGFGCCVRIPRQVDNELACSLCESWSDRREAAEVLRELAALIEAGA